MEIARSGVVWQLPYLLNHCHSEPALPVGNLLLVAKQQIPRASRFGMTTPEEISYGTVHHADSVALPRSLM
jgi:hypothetical protein